MVKKIQQLKWIVVFLIGFIGTACAQKAPSYKWQPILLGSNKKDVARRVIQNKQGEFVVVGATTNWLLGNNEDAFFAIVNQGTLKLNAMPIGSKYNDERANSVIQTRDGGYVIVGYSDSVATNLRNKRQGWIVKVDETGLEIWNKRIESLKSGEFTDVVEATNGDLWLTGENDAKLWVVRLDERGKELKKYPPFVPSNTVFLRGNGLAWAADRRHFWIVCKQITEFPKKQNEEHRNLLLVKFDTEGVIGFGAEKKLEKAEGNSIVRDKRGGFGIVGTSYALSPNGDILFAYADSNGFITKTKAFGDSQKKDEGFGIAEDWDGNFIVVGQFFRNRTVHTTQDWVKKLTPEGEVVGSFEYPSFGGQGNDSFNSIIVAESGIPIIVGKTYHKTTTDGWFVALNPSVSPQNAEHIDLHITPDRFYGEDGVSFLQRGKRGFYAFTIENQDTNDVFDVVAQVIQTKGEREVGKEYQNIHIGTVRRGEKRIVTIPFANDYGLKQDEWDFDVKFFAKEVPLSIKDNFHVSTRDILRHNLVPSHTFPTNIEEGKIYDYTFTLTNEGELPAKDVQLVIEPQAASGIKIIGDSPIKLGTIKAGKTETRKLSFETEPQSGIKVFRLPIIYRIFGEQGKGVEVILTNRQTVNTDETKPKIVETSTYTKPLSLEWEKAARQDTFLTTQPMDSVILFIHAQTELKRQDNIKWYLNNIENGGEKFNNVHLSNMGSTSTYRFNYRLVIEASFREGSSYIRVEVKDDREFKQTKCVVKRINPPNLYLLAVGVDYSKQPSGLDRLNYTDDDAVSMDSIFTKNQMHKLFGEVDVTVLKNVSQTKGSNIKRELKRLAGECKPNDVLMVLFSGHGQIPDSKGDSIWFLGSDYNPKDRDTYVEYNTDIKAVLNSVRGQTILFLDACQTLISRGSPEPPSGLSAAIQNLVTATPTFRALLSCSAGQTSREASLYQHGVFTQALLEAFSNKPVLCKDGDDNCQANRAKAGLKPDRMLTFRELVQFVQKRVPAIITELGLSNQNPVDRDNDAQDIPIFWFDN